MKFWMSAIVLAAVALLAGCGGSSNSNNNNVNVNGNWSAALSDTVGQSFLTFTTTLTQDSNNGFTGVNLTFTTNGSCFVDGGTESGAITISGNTGGVTTAGIQLTVTSTGSTPGNTLTLNGALQNNTINGTWTLNGGTGCTGNGTFSMTKVS